MHQSYGGEVSVSFIFWSACAGHQKLGFYGHFGGRYRNSLPSNVFGYSTDFVNDFTRRNDGCPVRMGSLPGAHSSFRRPRRDGLVRENPHPNLSTALDISCHCSAPRFDLSGCDPGGFERLKSIPPEANKISSTGFSRHSSSVLFGKLYSFGAGQQHWHRHCHGWIIRDPALSVVSEE